MLVYVKPGSTEKREHLQVHIYKGTIKDAGYQIIHSFREEKRGGGTAIIFKENLNIKKGSSSSDKYESFEYTYIYFKQPKDSRRTLILCIYRKQEVSIDLFCSKLEVY